MKKYKGSVSLFTAMIFLMVISVIATTIKAARVRGAMAVVGCAASVSLDSVFAEYNSELFSRFGVLLLDGADKEDEIAGRIEEYMLYNTDTHKDLFLDGNTDIWGIQQGGIAVNNITTPTDYGGLLWQDMVVEYEKYAKPINLAAEYLGIKDKNEEATQVDSICNDIKDCTTGILQIAKDTRRLVQNIDGVVCGSQGIDFANLMVMDSFYKQFCPGDITGTNLQIDDYSIFGAVAGKAHNVKAMAENALRALDSDKPGKAMDELEKIKKAASKALKIGDNLIQSSELISKMEDSVDAAADILSDKLNNVSSIEQDVFKGLTEEVADLKKSRQIISEQVCDVDKLKQTMQSNRQILEDIIENIEKAENSKTQDDKRSTINEIMELINKFSFDGMRFDYDNLKKQEEHTDILDSLSKFLDEGFLALVLPKDASLSTESIVLQADAASKVCDYSSNDKYGIISSEGTKAAKDVIYTEYVMDQFSHYSYGDDADTQTGHVLNYEAEYILYGKTTDAQNLMAAVMNIATIRSGFNMLYLLTDSEKKEEAYAVALLIAGASALEPLIRLVQYTLLYLWAYAEGIADARTLFANGKVPVMKTSEDWQLDLDNLMSHDIYTDESDNDRGMSYEDFIRFLLCVQDDGERAARTMDLVEIQMMKSDDEFRMKNMIYGLEAEIRYSLSGIGGSYNYRTGYTY